MQATSVSQSGVALPPAGLIDDDDVLPALAQWLAAGHRVALLTLVTIEGGSPRPLGAQMAVCEDGRAAGYLSGGCLEQALALEAQGLIAKGESRIERFGRGSRFFDVKLPCGSGVDICFDTSLTAEIIAEAMAQRAARRAFALRFDLTGGRTALVCGDIAADRISARQGEVFERIYRPAPRVALFGAGPSVPALCRLGAVMGLEMLVWAGDEPTRRKLEAEGIAYVATPAPPAEMFDALDASSAVVLTFHEHGQEPAILDAVLARDCFYIGVLGNQAVHRERRARLEAAGHSAESLKRLRAPIGIIPLAKSQATLALGVMAEIMMEAKARHLVA